MTRHALHFMALLLLGTCAAAVGAPGDNHLMSVSATSSRATGDHDAVTMSADGRFVVFSGLASTVVPGDTNEAHDVFIRDRLLGTSELVSVSLDGTVGNGHSNLQDVSADGRYVVFASDATNLVEGSTGNQIFVRDRLTGRTEKAYFGDDPRAVETWQGTISDDGRFVALQAGEDVFLVDRSARTTRWVSAGYQPRISGNGQYVIFATPDTRLLVAWNRLDGTRREITHIPAQPPFEVEVSISFDAHWVSFGSEYRETADDMNEEWTRDIFLWDRLTGTTRLVTRSAVGLQADGSSYHSSVSGDGRYVAFNSCATNLVPDGRTRPADTDIFIKDMQTGAVERVTGGAVDFDYSADPALSSDGRVLAFLSTERLVDADRNDSPDVYVHETGRSTAYPPTYRYNLRPASLSFGQVSAGSSARKGFTLVNTGEAPLPVATVELTGPNKTAFAVRSFCGASVAVGGHCWIAVTFKPAATGLAAASLHVEAGGIDRYRALTGGMPDPTAAGPKPRP